MDQEKSLRSAVKNAEKELKKKASKDNVENFMAASDALERFLARGTAGHQEKQFRNILEVVDYLKDEGWKIGKSRAYKDKKGGKIKAQPDGSFLMSDVNEYIVKGELKKMDGADPVTDTQTRKANADADKTEAQAEYWRLKTKVDSGAYVPREQMEQELAARAAFLKTDLENFFQSHTAEMVTIVKGDQTLTPELLAFCLKAKNNWLDRYAKQTGAAPSGPGPVPNGC